MTIKKISGISGTGRTRSNTAHLSATAANAYTAYGRRQPSQAQDTLQKDDASQHVFDEIDKIVRHRQRLIDALPENLRRLTVAVMREPMTAETPVLYGLVGWVKAQRHAAEMLKQVADTLEAAAYIVRTEPDDARTDQLLAEWPGKLHEHAGSAFTLRKLTADELIRAARSVRELASTFLKSAIFQGEKAPDHITATFSLPLYAGSGENTYPAFIHIYHQPSGSRAADTWLRLCLETENLGIVDVMFHLVADSQLDVRVLSGDSTALESLSGRLLELKAALAALPLTIRDVGTGQAIRKKI